MSSATEIRIDSGLKRMDPIVTILSKSVPAEWVGIIAPAIREAIIALPIDQVPDYITGLYKDLVDSEIQTDLHDLVTAMVHLIRHAFGL